MTLGNRVLLGMALGLLAGIQADAAEIVRLFNGKNLNGFYTYLRDRGRNSDPLKVFTVSDGVLRISGQEWGCVTTNEEFDNYRLVIEYKWGEKTFKP